MTLVLLWHENSCGMPCAVSSSRKYVVYPFGFRWGAAVTSLAPIEGVVGSTFCLTEGGQELTDYKTYTFATREAAQDACRQHAARSCRLQERLRRFEAIELAAQRVVEAWAEGGIEPNDLVEKKPQGELALEALSDALAEEVG